MRLKIRIGHRILSLALSLSLVLSLSFSMPVNSYASGNFSDTTGHWAEGFIVRAFDKDIVDGYPNGRFMPDKSVSRAEFVSMVNKAFDIEGSSNETSFSDVSYSNWYYNDVLDSTSTTYAGGYSDGTFRPNQPITRQEAAVMLSNILPSSKKAGNLKSFKDIKQIDTWAVSAFEKLIGRQYMGAYSDGKLHPKDPLTRAQIAKILCDILDNETIITRSTILDEDKAKITDKIYTGEVIIDEDLGEGSITIDNCVILGDMTVEGGGNGTVTINNTRIPYMLVSKDDSPVRIVTKGSTNIASLSAKQACVLQTSGKGGTGIQKITVNKGAELTLKGSFPLVNIEGVAGLTLENGSITTLTVEKSGKYSDITLTGKAKVTEATVNAESYFHGAGTISHMSVNADDITYETKPDKMTVATFVDRAMGESDLDSDVDITFKPKAKATDVDLDTKITVTFANSMKLAKGSAITDSNISSFLDLKNGSKTGDSVDFTATINSAKKVITITPKSELSANTKYYVVLTADALINASGNENDSAYSYFTTGTHSGSSTTTFKPSSGSTGVSASTAITVSFSDDVVKYSDGADVASAYLQECIQLKAGSSSGTSVPFAASISSADTITITPSTGLTAGQTYYVGVVADKLKTKDGGKAISASSSTWTVAGTAISAATPVISNFKLTPAENSIDVGFTPNVSGTVYALATTSSSITDTQIIAGKSTAATANTTGTLSITGLTANTKYYVYALLKNSSSTNSAIVSASTTTTIVPAKLSTLTLAASGGSNLLTSFNPSTNTYSVEVPYGTTTVDVTASAETTAINPVISITGNSFSGISVSGSLTNQITLTVSANNKTTATYVINVSVAGNTDLDSISIDGVVLIPASSTAYATTISTSVTSASIAVDAEDPAATVTIDGVSGTGSFTRTVTLGSGYQTVIITVTSNGHTKTYTIQFFR